MRRSGQCKRASSVGSHGAASRSAVAPDGDVGVDGVLGRDAPPPFWALLTLISRTLMLWNFSYQDNQPLMPRPPFATCFPDSN